MQAPKKGRKNGVKLNDMNRYGQTLFLTREETAFGILIVWTLYTTCENHRPLLCLARTHLRMKKINDSWPTLDWKSWPEIQSFVWFSHWIPRE